MRIRKKINFRAPSTKVKSFLLIGGSEDYANDTWGFVADGKGYKSGPHAARTDMFGTLPGEPFALHYSQANGAFYFVTADGVYLTDSATSKVHEKISDVVSPLPFFVDMYINGFSVTVVFSGTDRVIYNGATVEKFTDTHSFRTGVMHCGRFFAADYHDGIKLWWAATHAADWTSGINGCGYTFLPPEGGDILRLFSYDDRLIVVRKRGITVVRAYGEPQHYKVEATAAYLVAEGIIADTCAVSGGKITFCSENAIYSFDGNSIERLMSFRHDGIYEPEFAVGMGEMYYVDCATEGRKCILGYDCSAGTRWINYTLCSKLCACADGVYIFNSSSAYRIARSERAIGEWNSRKIDFGTDGVKLLKRVCVKGKGSINFLIECDGVLRVYNGAGWHRPMMYGREFLFTVNSDGSLEEFLAEVEVRDGI